jgi:hypothetical protein
MLKMALSIPLFPLVQFNMRSSARAIQTIALQRLGKNADGNNKPHKK